jgi:SnoaL-like domain
MSTEQIQQHDAAALATTVDLYLDAWNERDADRRAELVGRAWSDDGRLVDPPMAAEGAQGIADMAAVLHEQFPGHRFERASGIDAHHGFLRFAWNLVAPDGSVALTGLDVGAIAEDGRLSRIVGFFGDLPPREGS